MSGFSVESLTNGIESCKKNILVFEEAIEKERNTIKDYRNMMDTVEENKRMAKVRENMSQRIEVEREEDTLMNRGD